MSDHISVARLKKGAEVFEVAINPDAALAFRAGKGAIADALAFPNVYTDAKKGMIASPLRLKAVFGTEDPVEAAKLVIQKGDVQLTAEYKKQLGEQKRHRVIDILHRNGVDPRTGAPHPVTRIENALVEAKVRIDEFRPAEQQVEDVLKALRPIIPIKFVVKEVQLTVPAQFAPKVHGIVKQFGRIVKDDWLSDGAWQGVVEIPGGLENDLYDAANRVAHGHVESKVLKTRE